MTKDGIEAAFQEALPQLAEQQERRWQRLVQALQDELRQLSPQEEHLWHWRGDRYAARRLLTLLIEIFPITVRWPERLAERGVLGVEIDFAEPLSGIERVFVRRGWLIRKLTRAVALARQLRQYPSGEPGHRHCVLFSLFQQDLLTMTDVVRLGRMTEWEFFDYLRVHPEYQQVPLHELEKTFRAYEQRRELERREN